ncbi:hypothetical protein ASD66_16800 [Nocardioides sp. Root151]|nr:hypothetical protein ASD30_14385 [Nocardioides sp. Root140]KQZ68905.1 hypothetical protein ASD66_16800 [Nocardioides sp. Root151]
MAGCAGNNDTRNVTQPEKQVLGHVHGIGVDPADGALYAATHVGVMRIEDNGSLTRIADRWQDTMAFTVVGPGRFLGSGHPDLREDLPPHLGLIETVDAAETWSSLSLLGEADFHALDVAGKRIYAYDAMSNQLLTSTDKKRWSALSRGQVTDLVINPDNPRQVLVASPTGRLQQRRLGQRAATTLRDAPPLQYLAWPEPGELAGIAPTGEVYASTDGGDTWTVRGIVPGVPAAFDIAGRVWHAASDQGLYRSQDGGNTWEPLVRIATP